jgi:uncharacterized membrane protein
MELLFNVLLIIHIMSGTLGLVTGTLNMLRPKGNLQHKNIGKVFSISMLSSSFSALILSILHPSLFLFVVGIFTLYMVATGTRYLQIKNVQSNIKPHIIDWILSVTMLLSGILFMVIGSIGIFKFNYFGLVYLCFGFIGLLFVKNDFKNYRGKSNVINFGLSEHIQRMTGGFIASTTAFLVVNGKYLPEFIPNTVYWLLPTLVFTPLIIKWTSKYEVKK